jgi:tight adherence protein B
VKLLLHETVLAAAAGYAAVAAVLWLFYRAGAVFVIALPGCLAGTRVFAAIKTDRQKREINRRFADMLSSFASSVEAGETPEHALISGARELSSMYPEGDVLTGELAEMVRKIRMNETIESIFLEFAERMRDEDITRFADVFALTKRRGGDLLSVIRSSERTMSEKADVAREIRTAITAKRLEALIMAFMPPGMLLYFTLADASFIAALYKGAGRIVMTVLLGLYAGCILLTFKLTKIKV